LHCHEKWIFDQFGEKVCSALLATDGILLRLCPSVLENEPIEIDVPFGLKLMENHFLRIDEIGKEKTAEEIHAYISQIPARVFNNDDLTIVTLVNTVIERGYQPQEYYEAPNWGEIAHKRKKQRDEEMRKALPHLYPDGETSSSNNNEIIEQQDEAVRVIDRSQQSNTSQL
jgi:hypothetical protein